jgi:pilus assembly protein CpaB
MVFIALACALITANGVYRFLTGAGTVEAQTPPEVSVVTAAADLPRGAVLKTGHLATMQQLADQAPAGAFRSTALVVGRTVRHPIAAGAPVTEAALTAPGSLLETRLPAGYRAVGVFVDGRGGLQKYLQAGDRVDVVVTTEQTEGGSAAKVLLQDIEILEIPQRENASTYEEANTWMSVVLAVTPADAERLTLGMSVGTIQLLGRAAHDTGHESTSGVTRDTLLPQPEGGADGATYRSVEVIKGQSRTQERFSLGPSGWVERKDARPAAQGGQ